MRRDPAYLIDVLNAAHAARDYVAGMDEQAFLADKKTQDAVIRNFEIIGEAAKRLSAETIQLIPGVDWKGFKGFRDILIHEYDDIDLSIVWKSLTEEVPVLIERVAAHLDETGTDPNSGG